MRPLIGEPSRQFTAPPTDGERDLAANVGISFQTPEEFFLHAETEPYQHSFEPLEHLANTHATDTTPFSKKHPQELVIFCGSPGAGKSTFYWDVLQPLGYERVNQDILKTVCLRP